MNNYKIKVNDEAESKEAQELFFELGFEWNGGIGKSQIKPKYNEYHLFVKDGLITYCESSEVELNCVCCSLFELTLPQLRDLVAQSLISGADALRALADGKEVEYFSNADYTWKSIFKYHPSLETIANNEIDINHKFRLKPRTILINGIEVPAPAEDEDYHHQGIWILNSLEPKEYGYVVLDITDELPRYWWRTEEEIKQVVAALRGGIKG